MEYLIYFLLVISIVMEYWTFFGVIYRKNRSDSLKGGRLILLFSGVFAIATGIIPGILNKKGDITGLLAAFFFVMFFYKITIRDMLKEFPISFFITSLLDSSTHYTLENVFFIESDYSEIILHFSISLLMLIFYFSVGKKLQRDSFSVSDRIWLPLLFLSGVMTAGVTYFQHVEGRLIYSSVGDKIGRVFVGVVGILVYIIYLSLIYTINSAKKSTAKLRESELISNMQRKYFEERLEKERQTRKFRHDYNSEIVVVERLMQEGKYESAGKYLRDMRSFTEASMGDTYTVGNEIIDIILNYYLSELDENVEVIIRGCAGDCPGIAERNLNIIVSNLVRNAVEAVKGTENPKKSLIFESEVLSDELVIRIINTAGEKKGILSDKSAHQGIGLENVKETVEKCSGTFRYRKNENTFEAVVTLPLYHSS